MANIQHSAIPDGQRHEPKGISTATSGQVYVANGAASGAWSIPEPKGALGAAADSVYIADGAGSGAWTGLSRAIRSGSTADQTLTAATLTILDFDTAQFNTGGYTLSSTGRVTIPSTGLYLITAGVTVEATVSAVTSGALVITRNAAAVSAQVFDHTVAVTGTTAINCSVITLLTSGDIVDCRLIANGAASVPIVRNVPTFVGLTATQVNHLAIQRMG